MPVFEGNTSTNALKDALNIASEITSFSLINKSGGAITVNVYIRDKDNNDTSIIPYNLSISANTGYVSDSKILVKEERNDSAYRNWKISVFERDNYVCKLKDDNCSGRLEAHHIFPWYSYQSLRYEIINGITLCHAHHPRKKQDEIKLIPIFNNLLNLNL